MIRFFINSRNRTVRRAVCLICAVCLLLSGAEISVRATENAAQYETVEITEGTVKARINTNVRKGPGTDYGIITSMAPGEKCIVLGGEGDWYHIQYGEFEGYISGAYLETRTYETQMPVETPVPSATPVPTAQPGFELIEVMTGTVISRLNINMRQGPGTEFDVVLQLAPAETCTVLEPIGEDEEWYHVDYMGEVGYIAREYLEVVTQLIEAPLPTETPVPSETPVPTEGPTAQPGYEYAVVQVGTVVARADTNVRRGPGTEHEKLMQLKPGDTCVVIGEEDGWYEIETEDGSGYISKEYISVEKKITERPIATQTPEPTETPEPTQEPTEEPTPQPGYEYVEMLVGTVVARADTNVRRGPGTEHEKLMQLKPGDTCVVIGEEDGWYEIETEDGSGYVSKEYIETALQRVERPVPTETPEPAETPVPTETPVPEETVRPGYEMRTVTLGTMISQASASLRIGAGAEYAILTYMKPGDICTVLDEKNEWYYVEYDGVEGYIAKEYVQTETLETEVPLPTETPEPTATPAPDATVKPGYEMVETLVGTVNAKAEINVRRGPGTDYAMMAKLQPGDECVVIGEDGDWYAIELNGETGYVSERYLDVKTRMMERPAATEAPEATAIPEMTAVPGFAMEEVVEGTLTASDKTNIRKGPGTGYDVAGRMKPGEKCTVLGEDGDWYYIDYNGQRGYIAKNYIETHSYMIQVPVIEEDPLQARLTGLVMPGVFARKASVELQGVIESNIPIMEVYVSVYNLRTMLEEGAAVAKYSHDDGVYSFDLAGLSDDLDLNRLSAGEKRMTVAVSSANEQKLLLEKDFYVMGECADAASITDECDFDSDTGRVSRVTDGRISTAWEPEAAGDTLTIEVPDEYVSELLTLEWEDVPGEFEIILDGETVTELNANGRLSFSFPTEGARKIVVRVSSENDAICEARVYTQDRTPEVVHQWESAYENIDMMVIAAHPGDEFLFFGGAIPQAVSEGRDVLVVYMADCGRDRMYEAMDGLWAVGVRTHPICLNLKNGNPRQYEDAVDLWGLEETYEILVELLRRYKPDVVLTHDIDGEDGDNQHKMTSATVRRAVHLAPDAEAYPDSSEQYGLWDVKKTFIHRYEGNILSIDPDAPLDGGTGWTAGELIKVGFNKNRELMEDFSLSDGEDYLPNSYGMIRTSIEGDSVGNSFFNNID